MSADALATLASVAHISATVSRVEDRLIRYVHGRRHIQGGLPHVPDAAMSSVEDGARPVRRARRLRFDTPDGRTRTDTRTRDNTP